MVGIGDRYVVHSTSRLRAPGAGRAILSCRVAYCQHSTDVSLSPEVRFARQKRLGHPLITTIKILRGLPRMKHVAAWNGINRFSSAAGSILATRSLRSHLISDVDRPQERLIVICKDEGASRVAITRGLVVRS
jgi:hypothetical protein